MEGFNFVDKKDIKLKLNEDYIKAIPKKEIIFEDKIFLVSQKTLKHFYKKTNLSGKLFQPKQSQLTAKAFLKSSL